jgi:hypothetical protein
VPKRRSGAFDDKKKAHLTCFGWKIKEGFQDHNVVSAQPPPPLLFECLNLSSCNLACTSSQMRISYTGCFKKSFTTSKAYINLFWWHVQCFELSTEDSYGSMRLPLLMHGVLKRALQWTHNYTLKSHLRLLPFPSPLTTRRDYGGSILTRLHTGYIVGTGASHHRKAAEAWGWPLTSNRVEIKKIWDLYIHSAMRLHGVMLT